MNEIFQITADEVQQCFDFASAVSQSTRQFGSAARRTAEQACADTLTGKASEVIFQKFLRQNLGMEIILDFALYGADVTDHGQDVRFLRERGGGYGEPRFKVDVKGNSGSAQWLLAESTKFGTNWADAWVMVKIDSSLNKDDGPAWPAIPVLRKMPAQVIGHGYRARVCGFAYRGDFTDKSGSFWFSFKQGDRLIKPKYLPSRGASSSAEATRSKIELLSKQEECLMKVHLDAPLNYGLPIGWLRTSDSDWQDLAAQLRRSTSPSALDRSGSYVIRDGRHENNEYRV